MENGLTLYRKRKPNDIVIIMGGVRVSKRIFKNNFFIILK